MEVDNMPNEAIRIRNIEKALETTYELCLENGIENTTKEMVARKSGLSRKSIDRYFRNKLDCVVQVAESVLAGIRDEMRERYPDSLFTDNSYTGAELLKRYLVDVKALFLKDPRVFVLYSEFRVFVYHHGDYDTKEYVLLMDRLGNRNLRLKIYNLGVKDGSFPKDMDVEHEERILCDSYFGFLANLAMSYEIDPQAAVEEIDRRIEQTMMLY
jgi:AcrR family transcriptional regulator